MRLGVAIGGGIPNPTTGGGALTVWTIATTLAERGHEVTVFAVHDQPFHDPLGSTIDDRVAALRDEGVDVRLIPSRAAQHAETYGSRLTDRARRTFSPAPDELYPHLVDAPAAAKEISDSGIDALFAYHWEALAATSLTTVPRVGGAGDLSHLPPLYRWREDLREHRLRALRTLPRLQALLRAQPRMMVELLGSCDESGDFAAHHSDWLRKRGVKGCAYLRTPVPDDAPDGRGGTVDRTRGAPLRLLLLGHLRGIATIDGLRVFAHVTLPRLERELGDSFEVRIVGGYEAPPEFREALDRPSVTFVGHTEDAASEFAAADAMIVPTSIRLGIRVRIVSSWAHGCPVIAHSANAAGIPELTHGVNALIGGDGDELAKHVVQLARDSELAARLSAGGRQTYERAFAPETSVSAIESALERVAHATRR
jgi:hypothetical protein